MRDKTFNADLYQEQWRKNNPEKVKQYQIKTMINRLTREGYKVTKEESKVIKHEA